MRTKNQETISAILTYIDRTYDKKNKAPSMQEIADFVGLSRPMVSRYIASMVENGMLERGTGHYALITPYIKKVMPGNQRLPIVGTIACGTPILAEENIESYLTISGSFLGAGEHFVLIAKGDSMINIGIDDGDYVVVRKQNTANEGQVVVALIDNEEATLKRFYNDKRKKKVRLHPENDDLEDMFYDYSNVNIQGIAIKVIKNLDF